MSVAPHPPMSLPLVDGTALLDPRATSGALADVATSIDRACRDVGFFGLVGHGISPELQANLERAALDFFRQSNAEKSEIAMSTAGRAWRGWFPVGDELTSGVPDRKEGIYVGTEHAADHPRVLDAVPLHGANRFPSRSDDLRDAVTGWLAAMRPVADAVMRGIALGLGLAPDWFERHLTDDPTILFRIFHYPPTETDGAPGGDGEPWGVGEHTDYGLLTLLAQDHHGGLQVRAVDGSWIDVEPVSGVIVCNLGDMLERLTGGRYRSTPHRVRNTSGASRLSFPYFFDPSWDARVPTLPLAQSPLPDRDRWDGGDVTAWEGTYGEYLTAKVAKVFPGLFASQAPSGSAESQ